MPKQLHAFTITFVFLISAFLGAMTQSAVPVRAVTPLAQQNRVSDGQTCVAMCLTAVTGMEFTEEQINEKYGFSLLEALRTESEPYGLRWIDAGDLKPTSWGLIDRKVNVEKIPVIVALNGPEFSPSGRGHIVTVVKTEGQIVTLADPATGTLRTTTKEMMNAAPSHPDGNFVFVAEQLLEPSPFELLRDQFQGER